MKYFNVNYKKERQHFDTLESVKKCAQFAHVRNMQEKISQLNNAHMRSQSTLLQLYSFVRKLSILQASPY